MVASILIILIAVTLYSLVHSLLASLWAKARARRWFGKLADRWYRLFYNLFGVVSLLPVLALPLLLPDTILYTISFPWVIFTTILQVVAILALAVGLVRTGVWSFLGFEQLIGKSGEKTNVIVVGGLYRWVRHPLYTAGLVLIWLVLKMTVNLLALNVGLTLYIVVGAYFEERKLLREFSMAYKEYCQRTPMLVPYKIPKL